MGDKALTAFLSCCVQLLQILMEVTGFLVTLSPLSFLHSYVSNGGRSKHGAVPESQEASCSSDSA